jgi:hypothetical protein
MISRIKTATDNYTNISLLKDIKSLYPNIPERYEVYNIITSPTITMNRLDDILNDISKMINFSNVNSQIEKYINYIVEGKKYTGDIETNWMI